jgi:hypothetical protein
MAWMPEIVKLDRLCDHFGQGFLKGWNMAVTIYIRNMEVLVFMHDLQLFVMLPDIDLEANDIVIRAEKDILHEMKEEFGRELRGVTFYKSVLH